MTDQAQCDPDPVPLRIMLLGKCGAGKSSSGNTILNKQVFRADMTLARVTPYCEKEEGMVDETPVSVIDTPGFFETDNNKKEIVRNILKCVKLLEPGPHVFVFVVKLGRMTQEDQETIKLIESKFGPSVWDYTIVLFTHGDCLEGKTINDAITESDDTLRNFIRKCSGGFHVFNNKNPENPEAQVTTFMEKIQTLVALNGGGHYLTRLYPKEEREIRELQESILTEKNPEITRKENNLQERHQGKELQMEIRKLWRKEEELARRAAEKQRSKWSSFATLVKVLLLLVLVGLLGWALQAPAKLLLILCLAFVLVGVAFTMFPGKLQQHLKKKE